MDGFKFCGAFKDAILCWYSPNLSLYWKKIHTSSIFEYSFVLFVLNRVWYLIFTFLERGFSRVSVQGVIAGLFRQIGGHSWTLPMPTSKLPTPTRRMPFKPQQGYILLWNGIWKQSTLQGPSTGPPKYIPLKSHFFKLQNASRPPYIFHRHSVWTTRRMPNRIHLFYFSYLNCVIV